MIALKVLLRLSRHRALVFVTRDIVTRSMIFDVESLGDLLSSKNAAVRESSRRETRNTKMFLSSPVSLCVDKTFTVFGRVGGER
jgi:hypothetical protein